MYNDQQGFRHQVIPITLLVKVDGLNTVVLRYNSSWELIIVPNSADDSDPKLPSLDMLIPLREAAKLSGLSAGHLRLLVRQGDIWGMKLGRNWVTTAQAVEEYLAQDRRPGPKPKEPGG